MAGALGFEPRSSVLETDSLTVELTPLCCTRIQAAEACGRMDPDTCELTRRFDNILYISCNPLTLAENIAQLHDTHQLDRAFGGDGTQRQLALMLQQPRMLGRRNLLGQRCQMSKDVVLRRNFLQPNCNSAA